MAFGGRTGIKQEEQKPLGITARRSSTHEQARPVPYFVGTAPIAATFISNPWGVRSEEVKQRVGKKKETVGYLYFCSFAALFCVGPVDKLKRILLDGEVAWEGELERFSEDSSEIDVEGFGSLTFYWGTDTQGIDPDIGASGVAHPGYRGQCYAVFHDWLLGRDRNTVSNIVFVMERRPLTFAWMGDPTVDVDANPILPFMELWTSPRFGLGLPSTLLSISSMQATAETLVDEGVGLSPVLTNSARFQSVVSGILDHVDGHIARDGSGRLFVGLNREWETGDTARPVIGVSELVDTPSLTLSGWDTCVNQVFVRFPNSAMEWEIDAVSFREPSSFEVMGGTKAATFTRDWVTRQKVAWSIASSLCRQKSTPAISGTLRVRLRAGIDLTPGTKFLLTYARNGLENLECVVTEWSHRSERDPDVVVDFIEDRSRFNVAPNDVSEDTLPVPDSYDVEDIYACLIREMPYAFTGSEDVKIGFIPSRGSLATTSATVYREGSPDSFDIVAAVSRFGIKGVLETAFDESVGYASEVIRMRVTLSSPDDTFPDAGLSDALDGAVLVFVGNEILRAYNPQLVAADTWAFYVLRGAFGTPVETHAVGADVHIVRNLDGALTMVGLASTPAERVFKVQPSGWGGEFPLEDCPERPFTITQVGRSPLGPTDVSVNGARSGAVYSTGEDIVLDWVVTSDLWEGASEDAVLVSRADKTVIEIRSAAGAYRETFEFDGSAGPQTIVNGDLVAALGGELSFIVRVYFSNDGVRSIGYTEQAVAKI